MKYAPDQEPEIVFGKSLERAQEKPVRVEIGPVDYFGGEYTTRLSMIETYAAAFLKLTHLPADQVELVEERTQGETRWYFRKRV